MQSDSDSDSESIGADEDEESTEADERSTQGALEVIHRNMIYD